MSEALGEPEIIDWIDSASGAGWRMLKEARGDRPMWCRSVGWVIAEDETFVTLVSSVGGSQGNAEPHQGNCDITIPKFAITKRSRLDGGEKGGESR